MVEWFSSIPHVWQALLATLFTWSITALGASLVFLMKKINKTFMDGMLGFAAGVMIAASFWSLISPGIAMADSLGINSLVIAALGFLCGGLFLFIGDNIYKEYNRRHPKRKNESKNESFKRCLMLITSITLHNIPEGMAVGVAFGSLAYGLDGATLASAIALAIGIGSILVIKMRFILPFFLCFAAGCMIYVVIEELVPESQTNKQKDMMAIFTLIGFVVMMVMDIALG